MNNLIFLISFMFLFMKHPLSMGLMLLIQTIMMSLYLGLFHLNYWYSYILTLIMIGGMLILFIYMTSIASNEKFKFNIKLITLSIFILLMILLINNIMDTYINNFKFNLMDSMNFQFQSNFNMQMNKYYNYPMNLMMTIIIIYLLISLIAVVKISMTNQGPLRQMF